MKTMQTVKEWLGAVTEVGLLLVALGIVAGILFGSTVPFFSNIVGNLTSLIAALGNNGLVGLIALAIILWLFSNRRIG